MATFDVTAPDGSTYEVSAPDDATDAQIQAYVEQNMMEPKPEEVLPDAPSGLAQGLADPLYGASQLLESAVPDVVADKINQFNDYLIDEYGIPLERMGEGGADEQVRRREAAYQAAREASGETGMDWGRLGGNVASTAVPGLGMGKAATLGGKVGQGAAGGAAAGSVMPATSEDPYSAEKLKQFLWGSIGGGAGAGAVAGAGRMLAPKTDEAVALLRAEGVPLTAGQTAGPVAKRAEEAVRSVPGVGDTISMAHKRGIEGFNTAAINRSLAPINKELPKGMKAGREAIEYAKDNLGAAYNRILPKMNGQLDDEMINELDSLSALTKSLPDAQKDQFQRILDNEIIGRFTDYGNASGETLKQIESKLGSIAKGYRKSQDYDVRQLGDAVRESQDVLRKMLTRHNPGYAEEMAAINKGYANYKVVEEAAARIGSDEGVFTPAQLNSAVRKKDFSKDKSAFARGTALMQDLSQAGKSVMAQSVPDSGTPTRLMAGGALLGASPLISPTAALLNVAAMGGSIPAIQKGLSGLLTDRPDLMRQAGGLLGDYSGAFGAGVGGATGR